MVPNPNPAISRYINYSCVHQEPYSTSSFIPPCRQTPAKHYDCGGEGTHPDPTWSSQHTRWCCYKYKMVGICWWDRRGMNGGASHCFYFIFIFSPLGWFWMRNGGEYGCFERETESFFWRGWGKSKSFSFLENWILQPFLVEERKTKQVSLAGRPLLKVIQAEH